MMALASSKSRPVSKSHDPLPPAVLPPLALEKRPDAASQLNQAKHRPLAVVASRIRLSERSSRQPPPAHFPKLSLCKPRLPWKLPVTRILTSSQLQRCNHHP